MNARPLFFMTLLLLLVASATNLDAESASSSDGTLPTAIPAVAPQDVRGAFWRIDGNFDSVLRLRNILETRSLEVTPVLWMADGTEYTLKPITIEKSGVAAIDIREALRDAPPDVAAHASEFGSAGVRYSWRWAAIIGQITSTDAIDSLSYATSLSTSTTAGPNTPKEHTKQIRGNVVAT